MWGDDSVTLVPLEWLKPHEEIKEKARDKLLQMTKKWGGFTKPLIVDKSTGSLLDGHHRFSVANLLGLTSVPAICVDYLNDEDIIVETWPHSELNIISKTDVINMSLSGDLFPPKTSRHIFSYDVPPIFIPLENLK
tara:strand:+ start:16571 stop:16978 length:408 start_codon:yes stop_codon:yes gene_type:complete